MADVFDPRLTPARADLAAKSLQGRVRAARYVDGTPWWAARPVVSLFAKPDAASGLQTQLLWGEGFTVYEQKDGWLWGQADGDGYVGYVRAAALREGVNKPTHTVAAQSAPVFKAADLKSPVQCFLYANSQLCLGKSVGDYHQIEGLGWVHMAHVAPLDQRPSDYVAVAEKYMGVPYVWGGRSAAGLDCSALVQLALQATGQKCPRDTDMQVETVGEGLDPELEKTPLQRGDLIFWPGHVGLMSSAKTLLHANAHHMMVASEPLAAAAARIKKAAGPITAIRRL